MREIKYQVFHNGKVKPVHEIDLAAKVLKTEDNMGMRELLLYYGGGENAPLQYTGLKDKNGVEIYKGDVLRDSDGEKYEVIYMGRGFRLMKTVHTISVFRDYENYLECERIGNIYINPELLEKK